MRSVAVSGVGYTPLSRSSGRSVLDLATTAAAAAVEDAGLPLDQVDGVATFSLNNDSVSCEAVATTLALPELRFVMDFNQGGQSPCFMVQQAAMAVAQGYAENVVVFRSLNGRSGPRVGSTPLPGVAAQFRYPIGYSAYMMYIAMWARRYLHEVGGSERDLGAVAVAQRRSALLNKRAIIRRPLDLDDYLASPLIVEPFRVADCTTEVDGSCAVLVQGVGKVR